MPFLHGPFQYQGGNAAALPFDTVDARFDIPGVHRGGAAGPSHLAIGLADSAWRLELQSLLQVVPTEANANAGRLYMRGTEVQRYAPDVDDITMSIPVTFSHAGQVLDRSTALRVLCLPVRRQDGDQVEQALLNRDCFDALAAVLAELHVNPALVPALLSALMDARGQSLVLDSGRIKQALMQLDVGGGERIAKLLAKFATALFEFPLVLPPIALVKIAGDITFEVDQGDAVTLDDVLRYGLEASYAFADFGGEKFGISRFDMVAHQSGFAAPTMPFSFDDSAPILAVVVRGGVTLQLKNYAKTVVWSREFQVDDASLANVHIVVALDRPAPLSDGTGSPGTSGNKRLRGQALQTGKPCHLADAQIIIQAKRATADPWLVVSAGSVDGGGNFSIPYPYGDFVEAQALLSVAPEAPVAIAVDPNNGNESISDAFLYLLVELPDCTDLVPVGEEQPCDCDMPTRAARLPTQADLINSGQYTQDIGGACINLTTPNRTLREYQYTAIVRTSDPDASNYTLTKHEDGSFTLVGTNRKIARSPVDLDNPIRWQDAPDAHKDLSFYQAVTVATGHVLHYRSEFKADGYSLGDLVYSLGLAPGQEKQMVTIEHRHSLLGAETQAIAQGESLAASLTNDRTITDELSGALAEDISGRSSASTAGISAGIGVGVSYGGIGASLGVAGGYSNSKSSASQNSSRDISQYFSEHLRQTIMQNAEGYRQLNATVVTSVQEGQSYSAATEVVANHNHCHSLTMMYFEVLRHYAIYQELTHVEECVFVPLLMTNFDMHNIYKWSDVLARSLLPMSSSTYLKPYSFFPGAMRRHPLLPAFDAVERKNTNYAHVDFPTGSYDQDVIQFVKGYLDLRTNLERPKTRYDRIKSLPVISKTVEKTVSDDRSNAKAVMMAFMTGGISFLAGNDGTYTVEEQVLTRARIFDAFMSLDANYETVPPAQCIRINHFRPVQVMAWGQLQPLDPMLFFQNDLVDRKRWEAYAAILGYSNAIDMLEHYFTGALVSEWDSIYYNDIAPAVLERIVDSIKFDVLSLDMSTTSDYRGGERVMRVNFNGTTSKTRRDILYLKLFSSSAVVNGLKNLVRLNVENVRISYATPHFNGYLYAGYVGDDLLDGTTLYTPETADEKKDPRKEDDYLALRLVEHLNSNLEHYNKALWRNLDPDRRYMLLDGFNIQIYNDLGVPAGSRSLASVVKNQVMAIAGNSLVMPVAPGYRVDQSYIVEDTGQGATVTVSLLDHYQPLTPVPPYRISVPTRGIFMEAIQGACDACERVKENSSQDWNRFTTDKPTAISPVTPIVPTVTDWKAAFKDFATPLISIQNAPATPDPGAGLAGLGELLGKAGIFKDLSGLDANQQNVIRTYLSNQENAKAFAEMAKGMAMQGHNTENSGKIMDTLNQAKDSGALGKDDYSKLVKDHIQHQIDGGDTKRAELQMQKASQKPTLTDAAVRAADQGKPVKAQSTDEDGKVEAISIGAGNARPVLASVVGSIPRLKQENDMACWATAATMMVDWKLQASHAVVDVLAMAGQKYVDKFIAKQGLTAAEKPAFLFTLQMMGEPPANYQVQQYIDWLRKYGPLWVTVDAATPEGSFSPHARILTRIEGTGAADGQGTWFTFIDPADGSQASEPFEEFLLAFEAMARENPDDQLFVQIVHFMDTIASGEGYQIEGPWKIGEPVHETVTLAALANSTVGLPAGAKVGSDQTVNEFLRGVIWNDDPAVLLFDEDANDNWNFSTGLTWKKKFDAAKDKPSAISKKNLTGRSHFGDLQFLHAMASTVGEAPGETRAKILMWVEVMYRLAIGEGIQGTDLLKNVPVSTSFGGNAYSLATFFGADTDPKADQTLDTLLHRNTTYKLDLSRRAIGSILHLVEDSYAKGHVRRTLKNPNDRVPGKPDEFVAGKFGDWGEVENFHCYTGQDPKLHEKYDAYDDAKLNPNNLPTFNPLLGSRNAIDASIKILDFWKQHTAYANGPQGLFENVIFKLSAAATPSDNTV